MPSQGCAFHPHGKLIDSRQHLQFFDFVGEYIRADFFSAGAAASGFEGGFDPVFGARPLRRVIQNKVEDPLSDALLEGSYTEGDMIRADFKDGEVIFERIPSEEVLEEPESALAP